MLQQSERHSCVVFGRQKGAHTLRKRRFTGPRGIPAAFYKHLQPLGNVDGNVDGKCVLNRIQTTKSMCTILLRMRRSGCSRHREQVRLCGQVPLDALGQDAVGSSGGVGGVPELVAAGVGAGAGDVVAGVAGGSVPASRQQGAGLSSEHRRHRQTCTGMPAIICAN